MKKPAAAKIVEALGWAYVALAALAGMAMGYEVVRFGCGASAVVESVFYLLVLHAVSRRGDGHPRPLQRRRDDF